MQLSNALVWAVLVVAVLLIAAKLWVSFGSRYQTLSEDTKRELRTLGVSQLSPAETQFVHHLYAGKHTFLRSPKVSVHKPILALIVQRVLRAAPTVLDPSAPQAIIVAATREQATAISDVLGAYTWPRLSSLVVDGGHRLEAQKKALAAAKRIDIIVGTAGPLLAVAKANLLKLDEVRHVFVELLDSDVDTSAEGKLTSLLRCVRAAKAGESGVAPAARSAGASRMAGFAGSSCKAGQPAQLIVSSTKAVPRLLMELLSPFGGGSFASVDLHENTDIVEVRLTAVPAAGRLICLPGSARSHCAAMPLRALLGHECSFL